MELSRIRFTFKTRSENKGSQTFKFGGLYAEYKNFSGVESVAMPTADTRLALSVNPATAGETVVVKAPGITATAVYSISGALVSSNECEPTQAAAITAPGAGTYVVTALTANGPRSAVLIVR